MLTKKEKRNKEFFIYGNLDGCKVIKALEKLGGVNTGNLAGDNLQCIYYINRKSKAIEEEPSGSVIGFLFSKHLKEIKV